AEPEHREHAHRGGHPRDEAAHDVGDAARIRRGSHGPAMIARPPRYHRRRMSPAMMAILAAAPVQGPPGAAAPAPAPASPSPAEHRAEIETWRREREARLRAPDGWLSLVGLAWLHPG